MPAPWMEATVLNGQVAVRGSMFSAPLQVIHMSHIKHTNIGQYNLQHYFVTRIDESVDCRWRYRFRHGGKVSKIRRTLPLTQREPMGLVRGEPGEEQRVAATGCRALVGSQKPLVAEPGFFKHPARGGVLRRAGGLDALQS